MENINQLIEEYNRINETIKKEEDIKNKEQLEQELSNITLVIQEELKKEQQKGNTSEEFIQLCSKFDAITTIERKSKEDTYSSPIDVENIENKNYTLTSNKIISDYDGSEIDISNLSIIEKIKAIYDHTGVEINNQDPEILKLCDSRFQEFLRGCNPSIYQQKYGQNWKEAVEQIYKSNYLETVQKCIVNGLNEIDEKNRISEKKLSAQLEESEKEIDALTNEVRELKKEVVELTSTVKQIQFERKEELEQYKIIMTAMIKNNSEDKNRFYFDGTIKPDMEEDEYGRYTTSRKNRSRETGMQQRINDAAHVHSSLDSRDKERLQNKYEKVFGELPIQEEVMEEDKPKSR